MFNRVSVYVAVALLPALLSSASSAQAATLTMSGTVINMCVLTVATPGALAINATGTALSTDETGGLAGTLTIVASGSSPTIQFSVPTATGPAASLSGATKEVAFTAASGTTQAYTTAASTYTMNRLADTLTVKGRITNSSGFTTGSYGVSTVATCQQQ